MPNYITADGWVQGQNGEPWFRPFGSFNGPIASAMSPDGKWLVTSARLPPETRLTIQRHRVLPDGRIDAAAGAMPYLQHGPFPGYQGGDVLVWNGYGLFIMDAPPQGFGSLVQLNPETLADIPGTRREVRHSGHSVAGSSGSAPWSPTMIGDTKAPFVMLDIRDRRPTTDRAWLLANYESVFRTAFGLPLCVSDGRPPGRWQLQPGYYPVVVVYDPADWPWPNSGGHTHVSWGKATPGADVAIPVVGQGSNELTLFACVHESCHGLGLLDKYVGAPPGAYPGHVMGATRVPWPPQLPLSANFVREPFESATMAARYGSMIGRGGVGRT